MKKTLALVLAASALLSGCIVAPYDRPPPPGPGYRGDRDRDGVPNRYDRDRDNDGVPNRYDRSPGNPYRN